MSRSDTIGKHMTTVTLGPGQSVQVRYHKTVVWERSIDGKVIILRTGGWKTNTTKLRMNQAFAQFGYPHVVGQHKGEWYVSVVQPYQKNGAPIFAAYQQEEYVHV